MALSDSTKKAIKSGVIKVGVVGVLAGGIVLTCGNLATKFVIDYKLSSTASYTDILNSVAPYTNLDEILLSSYYDGLDREYLKAYKERNYEDAKHNLMLLYEATLEASICNYEGIEFSNVENFGVWIEADNMIDEHTELVAKCFIEYDKVHNKIDENSVVTSRVIKTSTSYILEDQLYNMAYNYVMLRNDLPFINREVVEKDVCRYIDSYSNDEKFRDLDQLYISLKRFLLTEDVQVSKFNPEKLKTSYQLKKIHAI